MSKLNWDASKQDLEIIGEIVKRALKMDSHGVWGEPVECMMDITATHANGMPLKLKELLEADDFNFAHDVFGIARHLNRRTGKLEDHFVPRFAK